jgi:hypothetical protein
VNLYIHSPMRLHGIVLLLFLLDIMCKIRFLILPRLELRPLGRSARSQSLYRVRCPGSKTKFSSLVDLQSKTISVENRLFSGSVCCISVHHLLPLHLLSKILEESFKVASFLYWRGTWFLTLREEYGARVFENRVLGECDDPKGGN